MVSSQDRLFICNLLLQFVWVFAGSFHLVSQTCMPHLLIAFTSSSILTRESDDASSLRRFKTSSYWPACFRRLSLVSLPSTSRQSPEIFHYDVTKTYINHLDASLDYCSSLTLHKHAFHYIHRLHFVDLVAVPAHRSSVTCYQHVNRQTSFTT